MHDEMERVTKAVNVFLAHPHKDQREILALLASDGGFSPHDAWRLYQFVPIAFCHVVLRGSGVRFQSAYISIHPETMVREERLLSSESVYVAAMHVAESMIADGSAVSELLPVFNHSAEYATINQLLSQGSQLKNIGLTEPCLFEFSA